MNAPLTGGWAGETKGGPAEPGPGFRFPTRLWLAYAAMLAAIAAVGATSYWMEAGREGAAVPLWPLAVNEATSVLVILALTPLLLAWTARLDPRRIGWTPTLAGHLAGMLVFGALHIAGMTLLRLLVFSLFARPEPFSGEPFLEMLIYEGRKDALTYVGLVIGAWLVMAAQRTPAGAAAQPRIEIRDGARRIWLDATEILWAEAAGNYVELHMPGRSVLRRQTLSALERELTGLRFVRIHRSRLVNGRQVFSTETNESGDFTVTLLDGQQLSGSRRWRSAVEQLAGRGPAGPRGPRADARPSATGAPPAA